MAPSVTVTRSIATTVFASASPEVAAPLGDGIACTARSRSNGTVRTGRSTTSSVISGRPDHRLASLMSAWMLPTVETIADVAVFRILQRDVVQRDVERRPETDLGRCPRSSAGIRSRARPAAGSPRSGNRRESRSPAASPATTMMAATAAPVIFSALMSTFQTRANTSIRSHAISTWPMA